MTEAQHRALPTAQKQAVTAQIADTLPYLVQLADTLGIDPVATARGTSRKHGAP